MKRILLISALLMILAAPLYSGVVIPTGISEYMDVAQMGMGGLTTMIDGSAHSLFYNPALLNRQKLAVDFSPAGIGATSNMFDMIDFVDKHQDEFENFDDLTMQEKIDFANASATFDNRWVGAQASPYLGAAWRGYAAGAYAVSQADVKLDQGVLVPAVVMRGYIDAVFGAGYGRKLAIINKEWELGATARFVQRRTLNTTRITARDAESVDDIGQTALDELKNEISGFGLDLGMIRTVQPGWLGRPVDVDFGVVIQDFVGYLDGYVKPNVKIGALAHVPYVSKLWLPRAVVGMEAVDFFNRQGVNILQRINIGSEIYTAYNFLAIRGGFHQGYPTWGAGLNFRVLKIDYAYFTRELGTRPGQSPESTHRVQMTFGY